MTSDQEERTALRIDITTLRLAGVMYVALGCTAIWLLPFPVNLLTAGFLTLAYFGLTVMHNRRAGKQSDSDGG